MPAVEVASLVVRYGDLAAVDGLSLSADQGEVVALIGPNGAGKTTTVETIEGYREPASGRVKVFGADPIRERRKVASRIGVMLQRGGVYPTMNARDALRLFAAYYAKPRDPMEVIARVGLEDVSRTPWRRLSGGEQQRLALGLAIVGRPDLVLLDEPTAGIDPAARMTVREIIRELKEAGACVVLTTHELDEVEAVADRVVIIDDGRVVGSGTLAELMSSGGSAEIRFAAPAGLDIETLADHLGEAVEEVRSGDYLVKAEATPARIAALTAWLAEREVPLGDLRAGRQTLEDVFLRLTAAPSAAEADHRAGEAPSRRGRGR